MSAEAGSTDCPKAIQLRGETALERAMGIEPTSLAWEARVIAIIRRPQSPRFYRVLSGLGSRGSRTLA